MTFDYYKTPHPVAYMDEIQAPVPGWGMTPNLAGNRIIGIGSPPGNLPVGMGDFSVTNWWSQQSTTVKVLLGVGGLAIVGGLAWYFLRDKDAMKANENEAYEENMSFEDVKQAGRAIHRGYKKAKPHAKRAGQYIAKKAKLGYEAAKPHVKRAAKATKKAAAKAAAKGAKKASLLLAQAAESAENSAAEE